MEQVVELVRRDSALVLAWELHVMEAPKHHSRVVWVWLGLYKLRCLGVLASQALDDIWQRSVVVV